MYFVIYQKFDYFVAWNDLELAENYSCINRIIKGNVFAGLKII